MSENFYEKFVKLKKDLLRKNFSKLNDKQLEAVFNINGPMVVLAGAGSGKTTAVINRIENMITYGNAYFDDSVPDFVKYEESLDIQNAEDSEKIQKVVEFLKSNPISPRSILSITFTNKAANEMKTRLENTLGEKAKEIFSTTFHSFCASVLRVYAAKLGYTNHFTIYDDDDSLKVIKEGFKALKFDDKITSPKILKNKISGAKDKLIDVEKCKELAKSELEYNEISSIYEYYQNKLVEADAMDFDDLILNTVRLFTQFPDVLQAYQERFKYILIDEYQDTNYAQCVLINLLSEKNKNLCVVGDDDQSIYKFRGACIENIINFEKNFPGAKVIRFEQNYRSTKNIINIANSIIKHNVNRKGKTLWTNNDEGSLVRVHTAFSEHDEANFIAEVIQDKVSKGEKYSNFAILYRKNAQSNVIEKVFLRRGISYRVFGGLRFYDRKEVKDMIAYLNVINNPSDETRLKRIINQPRRSIGERTISQALEIAKKTNQNLLSVMRNCDKYESLQRVSVKLKSFSNIIDSLINAYNVKHVSISELYELLLEKTQYLNFLKSERDNVQSRTENVKELLNSIKLYESDNGPEATLSGFLEEVSLFSDIDNYDTESDSVVLMTLHASKGLEFPNVFLPGFEEGIFPSAQAIDNDVELEEERRLAYVGVTRCKDNLYILNSDSRMVYGTTSHNKSSRFISEIPENLINKTKSRDWKDLEEGQEIPKSYQEQKAESITAAHNFGGIAGGIQRNNNISYVTGEMVNHPKFGTGTIQSVIPCGNDYMVSINFGGNSTKRLMANFSKLRKL